MYNHELVLLGVDFMITYRKPPSLKDMLIRAKITQPKTTTYKGCNRPKTCKYCARISQFGKIKNLNNNTTYNIITKGTCQSNNLMLFGMQLVPYKICRSNQK